MFSENIYRIAYLKDDKLHYFNSQLGVELEINSDCTESKAINYFEAIEGVTSYIVQNNNDVYAFNASLNTIIHLDESGIIENISIDRDIKDDFFISGVYNYRNKIYIVPNFKGDEILEFNLRTGRIITSSSLSKTFGNEKNTKEIGITFPTFYFGEIIFAIWGTNRVIRYNLERSVHKELIIPEDIQINSVALINDNYVFTELNSSNIYRYDGEHVDLIHKGISCIQPYSTINYRRNGNLLVLPRYGTKVIDVSHDFKNIKEYEIGLNEMEQCSGPSKSCHFIEVGNYIYVFPYNESGIIYRIDLKKEIVKECTPKISEESKRNILRKNSKKIVKERTQEDLEDWINYVVK